MIPQEYIQEVVRRNDIEEVIGQYVQLRRRGRTATGLCPFHNEKTPSFVVYPDTQSFYCFGCGAGGDAISFAKKINSIDYGEAVKMLAARAGMPVLAECGGFLYLQEELEDENGVFWPMAGVLSGRGKRASGTGRFGYISLTAEQDTPYLPRGETIAAHEFHRWDSGDNGTACRAQKPLTGEAWLCVRCEGALFAGFPHLYFRSNPAFASRFVAACGRFQEGAL